MNAMVLKSVAEIEIMDEANRLLRSILREVDHRMMLRRDGPLVASLKSLGEPVYLLDSNPTVERIARLLFDISREQGLPVSRVTIWETPTS